MSTNQEEDYAQLRDRLSELEAKFQHFSQLFTLPERVTKIEDTLLLVADVYRFKRLQELLAAGDWQQADRETIQVILSVTKAPDLESISPNDVRQFPCNELYVIDRLWTNYSQGRFGFSVQAQLYQSVGGSLETTIAQDYSVIERFGDRVGWRVNGNWQKCDDLDYTLNAPIGCHPSRWWNSPFGAKMTNYFFARLITCEL
jgi:molybdopterin converting factor small subunit